MLAASSLRAPATCAAGPLATPAAQQLTQWLYRGLRLLAFCSPLPLSLVTQLDAAGECRSLLRFLQAAPGTALPLAWQAIADSRLFARHQVRGPGRRQCTVHSLNSLGWVARLSYHLSAVPRSEPGLPNPPSLAYPSAPPRRRSVLRRACLPSAASTPPSSRRLGGCCTRCCAPICSFSPSS